jgi:hypothetical protein
MRERVTVSLPGALLKQAERVGRRQGLRTRSAMIVAALERLVAAERAAGIDAELDAYFESQTPADRSEERAMVRAFTRSRGRLDLDRNR